MTFHVSRSCFLGSWVCLVVCEVVPCSCFLCFDDVIDGVSES